MNQFFFKTHQLMSGQATPYTGNYVLNSLARKASLDVRASGTNGTNPTIKLFTLSPFDGSDIEYFSKTINSDGYYHFEVTGLPAPHSKAGSQGVTNSGTFWVALHQQN